MAIGIGGSIRSLGVSRGPRPGTISPANRGGDTPTSTASSRAGRPGPDSMRTVDERRSPASAIARGGRSSGRGIPSECPTAWTSASRTPRAASGPGRAEGPQGARPGRSAGEPSPGGAVRSGKRRPRAYAGPPPIDRRVRMPNPRCRSRAHWPCIPRSIDCQQSILSVSHREIRAAIGARSSESSPRLATHWQAMRWPAKGLSLSPDGGGSPPHARMEGRRCRT